MDNIQFEILGDNTGFFIHQVPTAVVDDNGEIQLISTGSQKRIKNICFLYLVGRSVVDNKIVVYEEIKEVNQFLMDLQVNAGSDDYSTALLSKALIHYFTFLTDLADEWDKEQVDRVELGYEAEDRTMRPWWDVMPRRKSERPTYRYKAALIEAFRNNILARTTAQSYMRSVVGFYKYFIQQGYRFDNDPFQYEIVKVSVESKYSSMKSHYTYVVHTTDLRLKLGKDKRNGGTSQELIPLSNAEWKAVDTVIRQNKRIIKNVRGEKVEGALAIEYTLFFLIARFSGLRKEEVCTLRQRHIFSPDTRDNKRGYCEVEVGPGNLSDTKFNKDRTITIPVKIMRALYQYTLTERYKKRNKRFQSIYKQKAKANDIEYLDAVKHSNESFVFISRMGKPMAFETKVVNARWAEIRDAASVLLGYELKSKPHNLRPTYAVETFKSLLRAGLSSDEALNILLDRLGHEDLETTLKHLKMAENTPKGNEIYEHILDYVFDPKDTAISGDNIELGEFA